MSYEELTMEVKIKSKRMDAKLEGTVVLEDGTKVRANAKTEIFLIQRMKQILAIDYDLTDVKLIIKRI